MSVTTFEGGTPSAPWLNLLLVENALKELYKKRLDELDIVTGNLAYEKTDLFFAEVHYRWKTSKHMNYVRVFATGRIDTDMPTDALLEYYEIVGQLRGDQ